MKLYSSSVVCAILAWMLLSACSSTTPEKYFSVAVLNTNLLHGFSDEMMYRQMEQPSLKLVAGTKDQTEPEKRLEALNTKLRSIEENYAKVQSLKATPETKDMIRASLELYEFVIPVYKTEYTQLARSFDENVPKEQLQALAVALHAKYSSGYNERVNKLFELGKKYADENSIPVKWGVGQMQ